MGTLSSAAEFSSGVLHRLTIRESSDSDSDNPAAGQKEIYASLALLILICLLILAFFTSYVLRSKKITAVHETVISIFAGMVIGLILRLTSANSVLDVVSFDYQFFFNLLLPPIILASGYELHQANFFRNIGTILTFAFVGTFISALVLGVILWLWTWIPLEGLDITFVDALAVGATLSATDPVTILAIFNTYKVDPKLYTIIFGESILNDAIAIVLFETALKYRAGATAGKLTVFSLFESIGVFLLAFFGSLLIGLLVGLATSLLLKFTHVRRDPKIESCLIFLIAYASYFFATAIHMSGIVALLFCGICLKHYAYHNMSRRTQLTTKFTFSLMAQLTENFIFIYLGLSLFTERTLVYKPLFILVALIGVCVARWCAVFPLSALINWVIRYRARRRGLEMVAEELPPNWKIMLYWAGLRGAVGVALAAGLTGKHAAALKATVLVTVVLTVIIFGGTTARMLEILNIRTGVVEEIDSDDEFDIEPVLHGGGAYARKNGSAYGHTPKHSNGAHGNGSVGLGHVNSRSGAGGSGYSTGNGVSTPPVQPDLERRNSSRVRKADPHHAAEQGLLAREDDSAFDDDDDDADDLDLPPAARRLSHGAVHEEGTAYPLSGGRSEQARGGLSARGALSQIFNATSEDAGTLFNRLDENFLKPHLLLDPGGVSSSTPSSSTPSRGHGNGPGSP